jgi:hypothetical protein
MMKHGASTPDHEVRRMPKKRARKLFSLDEANELVPLLTEAFGAIRAERDALEAVLPDVRRAAARRREGGGTVHGRRYVEALERITDQLDRVTALGVLVKDPDEGLCDFPCHNGGRLVLLCWRYPEAQVTWWHTVDAGFKGRRPVEELEPETEAE